MLKLTGNQKPHSAAIPSNVTSLSLSWLHGQFRALAVHRGEVVGTWAHAGEIEDIVSFPALLQEAIAKTGYRGQTVSLVLAHPRMGLQLLEAPPTRGRALVRFLRRQAQLVLHLGVAPGGEPALARYIERKVQQEKSFEGEAAWSYREGFSSKTGQRLLLHVFPRMLMNPLLQGCLRLGLRLTALLPTTPILHQHLRALPLEPEEVAVVAAETGANAVVLVGKRDGQILLGRLLTDGWSQNPGRFAVDLKRTILFVNQQLGANVNSAWLFGPGAPQHLPDVQANVQIPVKVSPVEYDEFYWAREALKVPPTDRSNLISRELLEAPQRQRVLRVAALLTLLLALGALATAGYFESLVRVERRTIQGLKAKEAELQAKHQELQRLHEELARKQVLVKVVNDERLAPVPAWFLAYLGEAVPPELVVTNLHVKREQDFWKVELAGVHQPMTNAVLAAAISNAVSLLAQRLTTGPFHLKITGGMAGKDATPRTGGSGGTLASVLARLSAGAPPKSQGENTFQLEGVMQ